MGTWDQAYLKSTWHWQSTLCFLFTLKLYNNLFVSIYMSYQILPPLASQHGYLSVSSETIPSYLPTLDESSCHEDGSQLTSLSGLLETVFDTQAEENVTTNASFPSRGSSFSITYSCPENCPCVCHVPALSTAVNQERPYVIMTPTAGRKKASSATCTHVPLQVQINRTGETPCRPLDVISNKSTAIIQEEEESNEITDVIPEQKDSNKVDKLRNGGKGSFRINIDGLKTKFKLKKRDWELMEVTHFPTGGRLLGGAWATIFKQGLQESNPWCNLRLKNNHVRKENSRKMNSAPFFRGSGNCKRPECNMTFKLVIRKERGKYVEVTYTGDVYHKHDSYQQRNDL